MLKQLFFLFTATATLGGIYVYHEYLKEGLEKKDKKENLEAEKQRPDTNSLRGNSESENDRFETSDQREGSNETFGNVSYGSEYII